MILGDGYRVNDPISLATLLCSYCGAATKRAVSRWHRRLGDIVERAACRGGNSDYLDESAFATDDDAQMACRHRRSYGL
jgi:hypothetical protein